MLHRLQAMGPPTAPQSLHGVDAKIGTEAAVPARWGRGQSCQAPSSSTSHLSSPEESHESDRVQIQANSIQERMACGKVRVCSTTATTHGTVITAAALRRCSAGSKSRRGPRLRLITPPQRRQHVTYWDEHCGILECVHASRKHKSKTDTKMAERSNKTAYQRNIQIQ